VAEEVCQGRAACELGRFEGRPLGEKVAEQQGVFVLKPLQAVREVVFQSTREAISDAHFVADHPTAMFDELRQGTPRRALGVQGLQFVAMLEQEFQLEFGIRGIIFGMTGREGCAVLGQSPRVDGKQDEEVVFTEGIDERAFVEFEAHSDRASCEPLLEGTCPRVDGLWCVVELTVLSGIGADGL